MILILWLIHGHTSYISAASALGPRGQESVIHTFSRYVQRYRHHSCVRLDGKKHQAQSLTAGPVPESDVSTVNGTVLAVFDLERSRCCYGNGSCRFDNSASVQFESFRCFTCHADDIESVIDRHCAVLRCIGDFYWSCSLSQEVNYQDWDGKCFAWWCKT